MTGLSPARWADKNCVANSIWHNAGLLRTNGDPASVDPLRLFGTLHLAEIGFGQLIFEQALFLQQPSRPFFQFRAKRLQDMQRLLARFLGQLTHRTVNSAGRRAARLLGGARLGDRTL